MNAGRYTFDLTRDPAYWAAALPQDGQSLDDFLQQLVAGITNLPPELVRPRWQEEPPPLPEYGTDWCAVGAVRHDPDRGYSWEGFEGDGRYYMKQHETFDLLVSCYGPHADWFDGLIRDGLAVAQNREVLLLAGMGINFVEGSVLVPELINQRWWRRVDRTTKIHREIRRVYPVLTILTAEVRVDGNAA